MRGLLFSRGNREGPRRRVRIDTDNSVVYAVGDVHGCYRELVSLEAKIVEDASQFGRPKLIVMLGDYVDRGPDSRRVLEHLTEPPPPGFSRICLAGNHEVAMQAYLEGKLDRKSWLRNGGSETLFSYGLDATYLERAYGSARVDRFIREQIPQEHLDFLRGLPVMAYSERFVFVHAGIRPGVDLMAQQDADLLNIREEFLDGPERLERWVVHGHTRVAFPRPGRRRLGLETGAYESGRLSAARIWDMRGRLLFS